MRRVLGIGFRAGADEAAVAQAARAAQAAAPGPLDAVATARSKAGAAPAQAFARTLGLPLEGVEVAGIATPTASAAVAARFATGSVAEAAALVAAGMGARIVARRCTSPCGGATAAIAEGGGNCEGEEKGGGT